MLPPTLPIPPRRFDVIACVTVDKLLAQVFAIDDKLIQMLTWKETETYDWHSPESSLDIIECILNWGNVNKQKNEELRMNFVTQLIYFIILFVLSSQQVFADEIAVLSLGREASRIQTSSNGDKILEYTSIYRYDNLLDAIIGAEGTLAKHDIVNWSDMEGICKIPEKKEILKTIDYLSPNLNLENSLDEMEKQIYKIKSQLGECGISNVLLNIIEETFVMSSEHVMRKQLKIISYMIDYSRIIRKIRINRTSAYQSKEFEIKSQNLRINFTNEITDHSKKIFKQLISSKN